MYYLALDKHGIASGGYLELVRYIRKECDHLSFAGLTTIGRMNHHAARTTSTDQTLTSLYVQLVYIAEPFKRHQWQILRITYSMNFYECITMATWQSYSYYDYNIFSSISADLELAS